MTQLIRSRPRTLALLAALVTYLSVGLTFSDLDAIELVAESPCSVPLLARGLNATEGAGQLTLLQGNLWMLPRRPLLVPYAFSVDREERLTRLVSMVRACQPHVVTLQEVFDVSVLEALASSLPGYAVHTSGVTDARGSVNGSGLVTLTRVPAHPRAFRHFADLPTDTKLIERLGKKGFLVTDVAVAGRYVTVINTHLFAARDSVDAKFTRGQLQEILDFVSREQDERAEVWLSGDFNVERDALAAELSPGWDFSTHGPTYDPARNPYTVRGANNTPDNHRDRRVGHGTRTVDFLMTPRGTPGELTSQTLESPLLSDHQFLAHALTWSKDTAQGR